MGQPLYEYCLTDDETRYILTTEDVRRILEATFNLAYRIEDIKVRLDPSPTPPPPRSPGLFNEMIRDLTVRRRSKVDGNFTRREISQPRRKGIVGSVLERLMEGG